MKIFKNKITLKKEIIGQKNLSFIPTMGGLHNGHKFLIKRAKKLKRKIIVSIYVNPKQFNSKSDFNSYPRNIKNDLIILKKLKIDYVYTPHFNDIFSFKVQNKIFLDKFSKELCGKTRKSHFKGVIEVVNRFLEIIKPKYIFLGKKDFQQLYLIHKHIIKNKISTKIIPCKTIRELNGVACSSRNKILKDKDLLVASKVHRHLKRLKNKLKIDKKHKFNLNYEHKKLKYLGINRLDYIKCINLYTLKKPKSNKEKFNIFIAYYLGKTRLIDNV
tara:strand:- start:1000 stop:1818 length:819 start_codon:yes stop_codon:yes gene_type:complete